MFGDRKVSPYFGPWRVDCRLARELPDDKPIRSHFLVQLAAVLLCAVLGLVVVWQYYRLHELRLAALRWSRVIAENREAYDEVLETRKAIASDAKRIENAAALLQTRILAVDFLAGISRTRPDNLEIDQFEGAEGGVVIRGRLEETPEKASRLLGKYVSDLRADPHLGPHLSSVVLTAMERQTEGGELRYEITFRFR